MTKMAEDDVAETTSYLLGQLEIQAAKDFIDEIEQELIKRAMRLDHRGYRSSANL